MEAGLALTVVVVATVGTVTVMLTEAFEPLKLVSPG